MTTFQEPDHEALTWFDSIRHLLTKHGCIRWFLTTQCLDCKFIHTPDVLHTDADACIQISKRKSQSTSTMVNKQ